MKKLLISVLLLAVVVLIGHTVAQEQLPPPVVDRPVFEATNGAAFIIDGETSEPGTYYLKVTVSSNGIVTAKELSSVVSLGKKQPPRDQPDDPTIPDPTSLEDIVYQQAKKVGDTEVANELSSAFSAIALKLHDDTIKPTEVPQVMKMLLDRILKDDDRWEDLRAAISVKLNSLNLSTAEQFGDASEDIAAGLLRASEKGEINLVRIIELIKMIIEILKLIEGGGI